MTGGGAPPTQPGNSQGAGLAAGATFAGLVVEAEVGRGGMGVIYRARDPELDVVRALKVLAAERSGADEFRERFRRESRQAAAIEHENVVPVYRAGEEAGRLFCVMRFIDGPSLADLLAERGRLELDEVVAIVAQVAAGLDAAHAVGLVHRDVKPANVILEGAEKVRHAFLGDFGISKLAVEAAGLTSTEEFVGTVDYVAPEQLEGSAVDRRADVYSLACVTYHALAGEAPFRRETQLATMFAHANAPRPQPEGMPPAIAEALARGLAVRPGERPDSAGAFARELARAAGAAGAAPTLSLERPRRHSRRSVPALAGLLALAGAALLAVALFTGDRAETPSVETVRTVPVSEPPLAVAVGPHRVWAVSAAGGTASLILPERDAPRSQLEIGAQPAAVAVGLGGVWTVDRHADELLRLDPQTGRVAERFPAGDQPADVAAGEELLWVASAGDDAVRRIDPESGNVVGRTQVGDEPVALAVAEGQVWVVNRAGESVVRIDEATGRRIGNAADVGARPGDVAAGPEGVWVAENLEGTVTRIDPESGEVAGEPIEVGPQPRAVAVGLGFVWVANGGDGTVVRIDPEAGEIVGDAEPVGTEASDIAIGRGAAWVADLGASTVTELRLANAGEG